MRFFYIRHTLRGTGNHYTDPETNEKKELTALPFLAPGEDSTGEGYILSTKLGIYLKRRYNLQLGEIYTSNAQRTQQTGIALARSIGLHQLQIGNNSSVFRGQGAHVNNIEEMKAKLKECEPRFLQLRKLVVEKFPSLPLTSTVSSPELIYGLAEALRLIGTSVTFGHFTGDDLFPLSTVKALTTGPMLNKEIEFSTVERMKRKVSSQFHYIRSKLHNIKDSIIVGHNTDMFCILKLLNLPIKFSGYDYYIPPLATIVIDVDHKYHKYVRVSTISLTLEGKFKETFLREFNYGEFFSLVDNIIEPKYVKEEDEEIKNYRV